MISKIFILFVTWLACINIIFSVTFIAIDEYNNTLQVSTKNGVLQGKQVDSKSGTSFFAYYGIPYAAPPVKSLRFRSPQPIGRWRGVLDATALKSGCVELQLRSVGNLFQTHGTEDCLYVNVFTPIRKKSSRNKYLPVIFYIYGGAFIEGSSEIYKPDYLIQHDLIIVTFNYRGGMFGFLSTEDKASYGNYGLKDQYAALKWVNVNIKQFGGDPRRVTMAGHSSGSVSAMYQMINPKTWGLYCGVIALSGEMSGSLGTQKYPRRTAFDIGLHLGIKTDNSTELIEKLRKVELFKLKRAQTQVLLAGSPSFLENGLPFTPVVEADHKDAFLTKLTMELLKQGHFARVPLLTGITSNEMAVLGQVLPLVRALFLLYEWSPALFPSQHNIQSVSKRRTVGQKIRRKYFKSESFVEATDDELTQMLSDLLYITPATNSAKTMSAYIPVYFYVFQYRVNLIKMILQNTGYPVDPSLKGAGHIEDIFYIWNINDLELTPEGVALRKKITRIWSNFARYGNPTPTVDPLLQNITWPRLPNTKNMPYLKIDGNFSIGENYRLEFVNFLNKLSDDE